VTPPKKGRITRMQLSWKIARIAGIDVYVHATFLLIFWIFRGGLPLVLAMFGCVLLHELGHALMARRFGIETADITLYPIGGVARLRRMPRAPGAELLIALAGPAVNFAIAGALLALEASGLLGLLTPASSGAFFSELLLVNLGLGVFNLLPAFPMDGGRVLRALLSGWVGRARATTIAARLGQFLAIFLGGMLFLWSQNPIHLALAAFIFFAARAEQAQVLFEERRRQWAGAGGPEQGIWTAPAGYRWVHRGNGTWQLAPVTVWLGEQERDAATWR
jgi:Zn-dependent protease